MTQASKTAKDVAEMMRTRRKYVQWQERVWSLPGEPMIGIVNATQADYWHRLGRRIDWLDAQIASIREAVAV